MFIKFSHLYDYRISIRFVKIFWSYYAYLCEIITKQISKICTQLLDVSVMSNTNVGSWFFRFLTSPCPPPPDPQCNESADTIILTTRQANFFTFVNTNTSTSSILYFSRGTRKDTTIRRQRHPHPHSRE